MPSLPHIAAFAAVLPDRTPIACAVVRRTYVLSTRGAVSLAAEQRALALPSIADPDDPFSELTSDFDLYPYKPSTDVVVRGRAHARGGSPVRRMQASVRIGAHEKTIEVLGDRIADLSHGVLRFSDPAPFQSMELAWARAFGGVDRSVPLPDVRSLADLLGLLGREITRRHPGMYPRNPGGTGYCVTGARATLEGLRLPNFEDPARLLTPDTLVVGRPEHWWRMPIPQGFGWFAPSNYPRSLCFRSVPELPPPDGTDEVEEVRRGWVARGESARVLASPSLFRPPLRGLAASDGLDPRLANGASPGLALPGLTGTERVGLRGLTQDGDLEIDLPGGRPAVAISFEGRALDVSTSLHTVLIEPDANRLSLVWGARAPMPRSTSTNSDKLDGYDVRVDGAVVSHALVTSPHPSSERHPC